MQQLLTTRIEDWTCFEVVYVIISGALSYSNSTDNTTTSTVSGNGKRNGLNHQLLQIIAYDQRENLINKVHASEVAVSKTQLSKCCYVQNPL